MNVLLPLLPGVQNGAKALNENGMIKSPVGQSFSKEAQPSGLPLPLVFSQILESRIQAAPFLTHGQRGSSSQMKKDLGNMEALDMSDAADQRSHESQVIGGHPLSGNTLLSSPDLETFAEPDRFHLARFRDVSFNGTNAFILEETHPPLNGSSIVGPPIEGLPLIANGVLDHRGLQGNAEHAILGTVRQDILGEPTSLNVPFTVGPPIEGLPLTGNGVLDHRGLQGNAERATLETVRQSIVGEPTPSVTSTIPLSKVLETGLHPQSVSQGSGEKPSVVSVNRDGEALARTFLPTGKEGSDGAEPLGRPTSQNEQVKPPILPRPLSTLLVQSSPVLPQQTSPVTAHQAEGPAGFTEPASTNPTAIKPMLGNSSVLKDALGVVNESRLTVPVDRHGEAGVFGKVDHTQNILETSVKTLGLDTNNGQSFGGGMNHSPNSQSGFQQPSFPPGQGLGQGVMMRALEERGPELPTPALQRLQMDVQLSEGQRVQIDVGVQNRQVYAGLVMDHSVLRNLAAQFVPQLENQLAEVDLELQEFSAEVREEREDHADTLFHDRQSQESRQASSPSHGERPSPLNALHQAEERGLHLVA